MTFRVGPPRDGACRVALLAAGLAVGAPGPSAAQFSPWATFPLQYPDGRPLAAGTLRVAFLPSYASYRERLGAGGTAEPLGSGLSVDSAGTTLLPFLVATEEAVRSVTGQAAYRITLGTLSTRLDGDVRRIPLDLALGLTDWLTVTARVSLVKTRMQAFVSLDSTQGNVGWNQALSLAENPTGATQITTLLTGLAASVVALEQQVGSGGFGCPGSASCDSAMAALARAQRLLTGLNTLSAASSPVMPLSASPAGVGLLQEIGRVRSELAGLGLPAFGGALVLPGQSLTASGFQTLIGAPEFGHALLPLATTDISRLGDTELGARVGIIQRPAFRVALHGTARLPTAARDSINHAVDLGTGDRQLDAAVGLEAALEGPGGLGLAGGAVFTRQFADQLTLRVPRAWALPSGTEGTFRRDLGDVWQLGAYPSLRLNNAFRVFGSVYYYRKAADSYQYLGPALPNVPSQEQDGAEQALHFGAGLYYRADRTSGGTVRLPVEAGLTYQAAFRGSGAHVPKTTMINMYLRLHYRVFGGAAPPEGPGQT